MIKCDSKCRATMGLSAALFIVSLVAPTVLGTPSIEPLHFVPYSIVFGGINVVAALAAIGTGPTIKRQLKMAAVTGMAWLTASIGILIAPNTAGMPFEDRRLFLGICIVVFFVAAQIPFWLLRRRCGLELRFQEKREQSSCNVRYHVGDILVNTTLVAAFTLWTQTVDWNAFLMSILPTWVGLQLLVVLTFGAPGALLIAYSENIVRAARLAACVIAACLCLGVILDRALWKAVSDTPGLFASSGIIDTFPDAATILITSSATVLCAFGILRLSGYRIAAFGSPTIEDGGR